MSSVAGALVGGAMSMIAGKKADKAAKKRQESAQEYNERMARERFEMQKAENRRVEELRAKELADERFRMNSYFQRKYAADMQSYWKYQTMRNRLRNRLSKIINNPGKNNPRFIQMKDDVTKATKGQLDFFSDALRRRGITGGKQDKLLQEANSTVSGALADTLAQIQTDAHNQKLQVEMTDVPMPYLGYASPGTMTYTPVDFPSIPGINPNINTDSNLGAGLGKAMGELTTSIGDLFGRGSEEQSTDPYAGSMSQVGSVMSPGAVRDLPDSFSFGDDMSGTWLDPELTIDFGI